MSNDIPDHYWKNLLAITTRAQADDSTPQVENSTPKVLDEENRKWLEAVMKDLVKETDPVRQLQSVINSSHQYASSVEKIGEEDTDNILTLADRLEDLLSISDLSSQFINNGGMLILEAFIVKAKDDEIRSAFARIILTFAENNEIAQDALVESGLLEKLILLLNDDKTVTGFASSLLSAISATVRSNKNAFVKFHDYGGDKALMDIVKSKSSLQLAAKAARIMASISYTMQDQGEYAKVLNPFVIDSYLELLLHNQHLPELEYIREFLLNYVEWSDLTETKRNELLTALDRESRRDLDEANSRMIRLLEKKFAPLRTG